MSSSPSNDSTDNRGVVLIIDDDPETRNHLSELLEQQGFQALTAREGQEGLLQAEKLKPDLITVDVMMPKTDGWSILATLKANPALAEVPVVVISAIADPSMGAMMGAAECITKPIDESKLQTLLAVLDAKRSK